MPLTALLFVDGGQAQICPWSVEVVTGKRLAPIFQVEQSFSPEAITTQLTKRRVFVALLGENIDEFHGAERTIVMEKQL